MEEFTEAVLPPELRDIRDLPKLTALLIAQGLSDDEVANVLGGSASRFFGRALPASVNRIDRGVVVRRLLRPQ